MNSVSTVENPFGTPPAAIKPQSVRAAAAREREVAEVQAAMLVAKKFPRDEREATQAIIQACTARQFAETALYEYPRGGQQVTGPSIRMAEMLAQRWGNMAHGIRELDQMDGVSTVEAFAWDMETNNRDVREFHVAHERSARGGKYALTDPRDIYEAVANQGARRLRAAILAVIPEMVTKAAVAQVMKTLEINSEVTEEGVTALATEFAEHGVTREQLEWRLRRKLETMTPQAMVGLQKILNSLRDGMSGPGDWFPLAPPPAAPEGQGAANVAPAAQPPATRSAAVKAGLKARQAASEKVTEAPPEMPISPSEILIDCIAMARHAVNEDQLNQALDLARDLSEAEAAAARTAIDDARRRIIGGE